MRDSPAVVVDERDLTGEGPLWHPDEQRLYWVDIPAGKLHRFDPSTGEHECCYQRDGAIGGFTIQADGALLLFEENGRIERWDGDGTNLIQTISDAEGTRFNDVIADPRGRVYCGTMPTDNRLGSLYRLDPDGEYHQLRDDVELPNGMGFSPDRESFYFTDSYAGEILRYPYDEQSGTLGSPDPFVTVPNIEEEGVPDGMSVDTAGHVWSARWNGGCVVRYDPSGNEVNRQVLPAKKITSLAFGGSNFCEAYVTSALPTGSSRSEEGEGAGGLFRLDLGVRGVPAFYSKVEFKE